MHFLKCNAHLKIYFCLISFAEASSGALIIFLTYHTYVRVQFYTSAIAYIFTMWGFFKFGISLRQKCHLTQNKEIVREMSKWCTRSIRYVCFSYGFCFHCYTSCLYIHSHPYIMGICMFALFTFSWLNLYFFLNTMFCYFSVYLDCVWNEIKTNSAANWWENCCAQNWKSQKEKID